MYYNHFYKLEYLNTIEKESVRAFNSSLFRKSQQLEEQLDKDLYNFNANEIEILLYTFNTAQLNTLKTYVYYARKYTDYAILKGKKVSNINPYDNFSYQVLEQYLAKYKLKYISYEDFRSILDQVFNNYDKALFLAVFEGIGGDKYSELSNLKKKDLEKAKKTDNGYLLTLTNTEKDGFKTTRELEISDELLILLKKTAEATEYYPANGHSRTQAVGEIPDGDMVFRNTGTKKTKENVAIDKQYIYRRMRLLNDITDGTVSGITTLVGSGVIYYLSKDAKNNEIYTDDVENTMKRFNYHINNLSVGNSYRHFLRKYKEGLEAIYGIKVIID